MKTKKLFFGLLLSCFLFSACKEKKEAAAEPIQKVCITDSMMKIVHIDSAVSGSINDELKLSGEIRFSDSRVVKVFPFSSGKVTAVKVSLGDRVSKGQVLAIIRSADVAGNYSDLSLSGNDVAIAKRAMDNTESLFKNGIASERELTEARQNYQKALTNAAKLQNQITINGGGHTSAEGNYVVTSPVEGYVVEKKITEGAFIRSDNADNMFTIGDISEVWVMANVYETDIARVREGYKAIVTTLAYPGRQFTGVIDKVNQILEPDTKVMKVRVRLQNSEHLLKPEMFANVLIENKAGEPMVAIPLNAYISDYGKEYAIVYHDKCNLEIRRISIIKTIGDKTFISSGLTAGEKVVAGNQVLLFKAIMDSN